MKRFSTLLVVTLLILAGGRARAETPRILTIGPEEALPTGAGRLSDIAVDSKDQPHIVCDGGNMVYFYDKIGGSWKASSLSMSAVSGSRQYYNPAIEIVQDTPGAGDVAWYSGILFGSLSSGVGIGVITRPNIEATVSAPYFNRKRIVPGSWDTGVLSTDPVTHEGTAWVSGGYWQTYSYDPGSNGSKLENSGRLFIGIGGEANSIYISKAGAVKHGPVGENANKTYSVWHMGTCGAPGYDNCNYNSSYRYSQGKGWASWSDTSKPGFGDDGVYTGISADSEDPHTAYLCTSLSESHKGGAGVWGNVFIGDKDAMAASPSSPLAIDPNGGSGLRRYAPQFAPHKGGGAWCIWMRAGYVMMRYISDQGVMGPETQICPGSLANACTDSEGLIHIVYAAAGIKYRTIEVSGVASKSNPYPREAVDFNDDELVDMVTFNPNSFDFYAHDAQSQHRITKESIGNAKGINVPYDYDQDGIADLAMYWPDTGLWRIRPSSTTNWLGGENLKIEGAPAGIPVPGNYLLNTNGLLGRAEIALYVQETGTWYIRNWNTGATIIRQFGAANALPVPRDYTGNGRTELAVVFMPGANWYIYDWRTNAKTDYSPVQFGAEAFIPAPADYDGDGACDIGTFWPAKGKWFALNMSELPSKVSQTNFPFVFGTEDMLPVPGKYIQTSVTAGNKAVAALYAPNSAKWFIRGTNDEVLVKGGVQLGNPTWINPYVM